MSNTFYVIPKDSDLTHHGILGMKWGVRRYQNKDGSYTSAGRARYGINNQTKNVHSAKLSTIGTLLGGPVGMLAGIISGQVLDPEQSTKLEKAGLGLLAAEVATITGFSTVSNLANSKKKEIEYGKNFVDLGDYFDTGDKNSGKNVELHNLGIDQFEIDKFHTNESREAIDRVKNVVLPEDKMSHPGVDPTFRRIYEGVPTTNPARDMSDARNRGYISRLDNHRSVYGRKNLPQDDFRIIGRGGELDNSSVKNLKNFVDSKEARTEYRNMMNTVNDTIKDILGTDPGNTFNDVNFSNISPELRKDLLNILKFN